MTDEKIICMTDESPLTCLTALCGKKWEWITDIPGKVTCPECKKKMEVKK